jgi:hypothetical protein
MVSDRGQLLLVGAVAVSFVMLGTVAMLNTLQYTNNQGADANGAVVEQASAVKESVRLDLHQLHRSVRAGNPTPSTLEANLQSNLTTFESQQNDYYATRDGSSLMISYDSAASAGTRIEYSGNNFKPPSAPVNGCGPQCWKPVNDVEQLGMFTMEIEDMGGVGVPNDFEVIASGTQTWQFKIEQSSPSGELTLETNPPSAGSYSNPCSGELEPPVSISFVAGKVTDDAGTSCTFEPITTAGPDPYDLRYEGWNNVGDGEYQISVRGDVQTTNFNSGNLHSHPVIAGFDVAYHAPEYKSEWTITVDGEGETP